MRSRQTRQADEAVPARNSPGIVIASVASSIVGAVTVLALLGARTSNVGRRNTVLLLLASLAMSGVSIWSMHVSRPRVTNELIAQFIGIHFSLVPADGLTWHLALSPLWLSLSFIVPLATISIAFLVLGSQDQLSAVRCVVAGVLAGLIVVLMHASANFNLSFRIVYSPAYMVVAGLLACIGCSVALLLFFYARVRHSLRCLADGPVSLDRDPAQALALRLSARFRGDRHALRRGQSACIADGQAHHQGTSYFCRDDVSLYLDMPNDDGRRWLIRSSRG